MEGFHDSVRCLSAMREMMGLSARGIGTPVFFILSKSEYWSAIGRLPVCGSRAGKEIFLISILLN